LREVLSEEFWLRVSLGVFDERSYVGLGGRALLLSVLLDVEEEKGVRLRSEDFVVDLRVSNGVRLYEELLAAERDEAEADEPVAPFP